jgi:hypothetical protein
MPENAKNGPKETVVLSIKLRGQFTINDLEIFDPSVKWIFTTGLQQRIFSH